MSVKLLKTDAKGRVSLGQSFANVPVQLEARDGGEWVLRLVEAIPVKEAWLFKNQEALNLVTSGILQAQQREFAQDPRVEKHAWLEEMDDV